MNPCLLKTPFDQPVKKRYYKAHTFDPLIIRQ